MYSPDKWVQRDEMIRKAVRDGVDAYDAFELVYGYRPSTESEDQYLWHLEAEEKDPPVREDPE